MSAIKIKTALISVFSKDKLENILPILQKNGVEILSTGGTAKFIEEKGIEVKKVEELTGFPSILSGRVKTLHPLIFGGLLADRNNEKHLEETEQYNIPAIDLLIVDLYPFEKTVASTDEESQIIEKIDIGGVSLIRAAAKNYRHLTVISDYSQLDSLAEILEENDCSIDLEQRKKFATEAFLRTQSYDFEIFKYFAQDSTLPKIDYFHKKTLRYGENPHQTAEFYGNLDEVFNKLNGKALSYNNLNDIDAALHLVAEFEEPTFAILKHTNPCGLATGKNVLDAWERALACDPISAFGGILITNQTLTLDVAKKISEIFYEVLIAPSFEEEALELLKLSKKRIILQQKAQFFSKSNFKSTINGCLVQDQNPKGLNTTEWETVTTRVLTEHNMKDAEFGMRAIKTIKSNAICIVKNQQMIGSGVGQTSRVDAVNQAISKAKQMGFDLRDSVLVSDAFFPFADSIEIANKAGVEVFVQPGGSIKDQDSIDFCEKKILAMVFTQKRHFKH